MYKHPLKVAAFKTVPLDDTMEVAMEAFDLKKKIVNTKGWKLRNITVTFGDNADDFIKNLVTIVVQGFRLYRKPRFIRPNHNRYENRK